MSDHDHRMIGCPAHFFEHCQECDSKLPQGREDYLCSGCRQWRIRCNRKTRDPITGNREPAQFVPLRR